jgi:endo-1,4-beta-xylanase
LRCSRRLAPARRAKSRSAQPRRRTDAISARRSIHAFDAKPYRDLAATQPTSVTPENAMKWESVEPLRGQFRWRSADAVVAFAKANGQKVRGHTLVWHSQLPLWLINGRLA